MKCYQHRESDAIGICKACGKALCPECIADLGFAICCKGSCEDAAAAMHNLNNNARQVYSAQKRSRYLAPLFFVFAGLAFMGFAVTEAEPVSFGTVCGFIFTVFGIFLFLIQHRLMKKVRT